MKKKSTLLEQHRDTVSSNFTSDNLVNSVPHLQWKEHISLPQLVPVKSEFRIFRKELTQVDIKKLRGAGKLLKKKEFERQITFSKLGITPPVPITGSAIKAAIWKQRAK
jgi:hypothetical protein